MTGRSRDLYQLAWEAHEKAFGCPPIIWGFWAENDEYAKRILAAVVKGVPLDTTPDGYDPNDVDQKIVG